MTIIKITVTDEAVSRRYDVPDSILSIWGPPGNDDRFYLWFWFWVWFSSHSELAFINLDIFLHSKKSSTSMRYGLFSTCPSWALSSSRAGQSVQRWEDDSSASRHSLHVSFMLVHLARWRANSPWPVVIAVRRVTLSLASLIISFLSSLTSGLFTGIIKNLSICHKIFRSRQLKGGVDWM